MLSSRESGSTDLLAVRMLVALPVLGLVVMVVAWLRYGIDLPLADDWRSYLIGEAGSFNPVVLFRPANDTLYPVGKFLDAVAFHLLDGNVIAYQTVSMTVTLGALLLLQWSLLTRILDDRLAAAACFGFCMMMIQPDSYWGLQYIGYHQAIPLVCFLATLHLALFAPETRIGAVRVLSLLLGLVAGLAYISGAFGILALAIVLAVVSTRYDPARLHVIRTVAWPALLAGVLTSLAQLWVIVVVQKGTHRPDAPMAMPYQPDFWLYLAGKVARSLSLPPGAPLLSLGLSVAVVAGIVALALWALAPLPAPEEPKAADAQRLKAGTILAALGSAVFVYLLLVAAGRAKLWDDSVHGPMDVFRLGFYRFHYYWITLLWPWVVAVGILLVKARRPSTNLHMRSGFVVIGLAGVALGINGGSIKYKMFRIGMQDRKDGLDCLIRSVQEEKMDCPTLYPQPIPRSAITFAARKGASFTRLIPGAGDGAGSPK